MDYEQTIKDVEVAFYTHMIEQIDDELENPDLPSSTRRLLSELREYNDFMADLAKGEREKHKSHMEWVNKISELPK